MAACVQAFLPPSGAGPGSHRDEVAERRDMVLESGGSPDFGSCVVAWASVLRSVREMARSSSSSSGIGHAARPSGSSKEGERFDFGFSSPLYGCSLGDAMFNTYRHVFNAGIKRCTWQKQSEGLMNSKSIRIEGAMANN
jgi:hypothetical protein